MPAPSPARKSRCLPLALGLAAALTGAGGCGRSEAPPVAAAPATARAETVSGRVTWSGDRVLPDPEEDGALLITQDGTVLDLGGALLAGAPGAGGRGTPAPDSLRGVGIVVRGARGVTIRGGRVAGYRVGIQAFDAPGLVLEDVDASWNWRQRLHSTEEESLYDDWLWPHYDDEGEWDRRYGAGISLRRCDGARVRGCRVHAGQNGILLAQCRGAAVTDNDVSFNSGWGIALWRTCASEVSHNRCDACVRGFVNGVYHAGQDSAGLLVFEQSCDNVIARNSATHCGNGLFLYAGHETTERTGRGGSNRNRIEGNDLRFAIANGIEATFSVGNVYVDNDVSGSEHGVWAGYSQDCTFLRTVARGCARAGVLIEHGSGNRIDGSVIEGAPLGVHLWWDEDPAFVEGVLGRERDTSSARNRLVENRIQAREVALRLDGDQDSVVLGNTLTGGRAALETLGRTRLGAWAGNVLAGGSRGDAARLLVNGPDAGPRGTVEPPPLPALQGRQRTAYGPERPEGREHIRLGPWGPLDPLDLPRWQPRLLALTPERLERGAPEGRIQLAGEGPFSIEAQGDVTVEPAEGTAPAVLRVRAGPTTGLKPFQLLLRMGEQRVVAHGSLLRAEWHVRHFTWVTSPLTSEKAFQALLQGTPASEARTGTLDFRWYSDAPAGVDPDRFATLATSRVRLPAGRYELKTVSDDGVRVFVDGRRALANWTGHGPTEDRAELDLEDGEHDLRVEHFDLNGWAYLTLALRRLSP